jgi:hypothetical protein
MTNTTLDDVQRLADQLSPLDQARLMEYLVQRIVPVVAAAQPVATAPNTTDAWARWDAFRAEFHRTYPDAPSIAAQLDADRRTRDAVLTGRDEDSDVHT